MIKILHICHKYGRNDLFYEQVNLDPEKYRSVILFLRGAEEENQKSVYEEAGHKVLFFEVDKKHIRWYNLPLLRKISSLIDAENFDIVFCQQQRSIAVGVLGALLSRRKPEILAAIHGLGSCGTLKRKFFNYFLYKRLRKIISVSHAVRQDIISSNLGNLEGKVVTVHNGLDYSDYLPVSDREAVREEIHPGYADHFWFGIVGRLSEVKNHTTLLSAFQKVLQEKPRCILLIAGKGPLEAQLQKQASDLGIENKVVFLGYRTDIPRLLQAFDVFLLPSLREGLPLAMLEAMATGLPVVAGRVGGIPEVFDCPERFGTLVDPLDPSSIAAAMLEMSSAGPEELRRMGQTSRQRALEDFSAEQMRAAYQALFTETACSS